FMMTNKTNRIFKRIATVTLNDNGVKTEYKFYQVPNTASYFSRRDAVVNMTPRKVKSKVRHPLAPVKEQSAVLTAEEYQRIAAERKKGVRRKSASVATNYVSAANQKFAQGGQVTYLVNISHLRASHAGGEDTAENVTITTASHNQGSRRAFIEDVAKKIVLEMGWLNFHCRSDLATDKEGSLTHVAGKLEVSILEREGKSITVELDPQNPESASLASHELATMMFEWLFLGKISQQLKGGVSKAEDNEVPAWVPPSPFKPFAPEEKENKVPVADLLSPKRSRQLVEKKSELPNFASPERRFAELGRFGVFESSSPRALHFPEPEEGTDSVDGIKEEFDDDCSTSLLSFR
ncbi:MAG: hypothetical protein KDH94_04740, partial [Coxiellaceae bacterium]|nr:hypothetical protein [Coxiellaceae bacterium]